MWIWKGHDVSGYGYKPIWTLDQKIQDDLYAKISRLKDAYAAIKSVDPKRPVFLNHAPRLEIEELQCLTATKPDYVNKTDGRTAGDVWGADVYPVPGGGGNNGAVKGHLTWSIATVGAHTRKQREIAGSDPIYMVIQACGIEEYVPQAKEEGRDLRRPTFHEERFMAFQAVANGVNGILWWGASFIPADSQLWLDIKRVARQLGAMEPVLAEGEVAPVRCSSSDVELIRYTWKNHNYVIAANTANRHLDSVSLRWQGLASKHLNVLFEGRSLPASASGFRDSFAPFDVHIYSDDFSSSVVTSEKVKCAFGLPLESEPFKGKSNTEVAQALREMGISAVCAVRENKDLIRALHQAGIKAYAEMSVFIGKNHWDSHPESRPIDAEGKPMGEPSPGYCGVCPNQDWLRSELVVEVKRRFERYEYDGLWLDFIRYGGKWEQKGPALEEICFCPVCLDKFSKLKHIKYPAGLKTTKDKAQWILANHRQEWTDFKCDSITEFVGQVKQMVTQLNPEGIVGIFNVPWTREDLDGAVLKTLGQDIRSLAKYVDVFSPMVYHEMCHFPRKWVADYTNYVWENTNKQVWPIVQVCDDPVVMTPEDVFRTLRTGMDCYGSSGVMMYAFSHILEKPEKVGAMKEAFGKR